VLKRIEFDGEIPAEEITRRDELVRRVGVESKEELFRVMAEELATDGVSVELIEEKLWDREGVDNTYIGNGVAFPHAIVDQLESTQGKVFLLEDPIEYAEDGEEVELVTALVGPTDERRYHLSIIGQFSQLLVDDNVKDLLLNSDDPEARLRRILRETSDE
jgi:PTS system nitrogen regulatory IIA component